MRKLMLVLFILLSLIVTGCGKDYICRPEVPPPAPAPADSSECGDEDDD